ncbi:MAG: VVA0879 family protein [Methyloversatilis sp.]|uniref:VVA0879 family protein n=1 Tax=Methyloversatilis sp. TaxID=2569862 RepID=UPI002733A5E9|nr:VVA0879 family protein [Methyloversatilis sp.]MDP3871266.1 VVA0879 family protein [Methyloversatilis sp.]
MDEIKTYTHAEWLAEAERRFGADRMKWRFVCPSCSHVACVQDWKDAGARTGEVAFSCVGRALGTPEGDAHAFRYAGGPCNYTSGGLFCINGVQVITDDGKTIPVFDFDGAAEVSDAAH